jgi:trans-aconitate methyltransferase
MSTKISLLNEMYQRAELYDIVFERDVSHEIRFFRETYQHFTGRQPTSAVELACGPGYHSREFARQGLRTIGVDLSEGMIRYAQEKVQTLGLDVQFMQANMRHFQLGQPVDMAIAMFDSIDFLLDFESMIDHFTTIAANLTPGGLYFVQQSVPFRYYAPHRAGVYVYKGERDGLKVEFHWNTQDALADYFTGISHVEMDIHVFYPDGRHEVFGDTSIERNTQPTELVLVAEHVVGQFKTLGHFGEFDLNRVPDWSGQVDTFLTVFQKISD